jgi:hypothetical protein
MKGQFKVWWLKDLPETSLTPPGKNAHAAQFTEPPRARRTATKKGTVVFRP